MRTTLRMGLVAPIVILVGGLTAAHAADGERIVTHVVRPGDTLRDITAIYSRGVSWQENWRLNPKIENPNLLFPGERVKVYVRPALPARSAEVRRLGPRVEEQPTPVSWMGAQQGDVLHERDGVRTPTKASAELVFADGVRLVVGEESMLFLRESGSSTARPGVRAEAVEVVVGQADVDRADAGADGDAGIEIRLGRALARPRTVDGGDLRARTRRPESGGAQVMVYAGRSDVESGGHSVELEPGMGTSVPEIGPPSPPEKLLAAPAAVAPAAEERLAIANPVFSWEAVDGASSYAVEICLVADCGAIADSVADLREPRWRHPRLAMGTYYWRVRGRSASGLDGFGSEPQRFDVTSDLLGGSFAAVGLDAQGPQAWYAGSLVLGPGAVLRLEETVASPDPSRRLTLDEAPAGDEALVGPWEAGPHRVAVTAIDAAGDAAVLAALPFVWDPDPPVLYWEIGEEEALLERHGLGEERDNRSEYRRSRRHRQVQLEWSSDGNSWQPVVPADPDERPGAAGTTVVSWRIGSDRPQVFVRARRNREFRQLDLERGEVLRLTAQDPWSAVRHANLTIEENGDGSYELRWQVTDLVGNTSAESFPLAVEKI